MRLLNVSAGRIQTVQIGSEVVRTAHVKEPLAGPWIIGENGVEGDHRAVHPDKLYAFSRSAYDYWGAELGVDPARWPDGFFGENLTLDTLDETDLRVGDVFALGDEVRIFVAGARNPCIKLSWRLAQPPTFQKRFAKSRHAGVYFGVERPGRVQPGDRLERVHSASEMPSVADVSGFIIDAEPPPLTDLERLLACPRLSAMNRILLTPKVEASARAADAVEGRWRGWRAFKVRAVVDEAADVRSAYLLPDDGERLPRAKPGQFVTLEMDGGDEPAASRCWSLSSYAHEPTEYRVTVRRQEGEGSQRFHKLEPGDLVRLRCPAGEFTLDAGSFRPVVLVAAGIGITPLKAMLDAQLARRDGPAVHLIYGGRKAESLAFREELEALARSRDDFDLTLVYSRTEAPGAATGRITPDLITRALSDLSVVVDGHRHALPWFEANMYICGPNDFCVSIRDGLIARGANANQIFFELFTRVPEEATEVATARITFARSGLTATWRNGDDLSLLELAEANGIEIASSCRAGSCMTCRSTLIEGDATGALGDGTVLPCVARPKTAELTLAA